MSKELRESESKEIVMLFMITSILLVMIIGLATIELAQPLSLSNPTGAQTFGLPVEPTEQEIPEMIPDSPTLVIEPEPIQEEQQTEQNTIPEQQPVIEDVPPKMPAMTEPITEPAEETVEEPQQEIQDFVIGEDFEIQIEDYTMDYNLTNLTTQHDSWYGTVTGNKMVKSITMGDFDGDGNQDLLLGADEEDYAGMNLAGRVYLIYGPMNGSKNVSINTVYDASWYGDISGTVYYAGTCAGSGDVNNDNYDDFIFGADSSVGNNGLLFLLHGSPTRYSGDYNLSLTSSFNASWEGPIAQYLGTDCDIGNSNGDDYDDILVSSVYYLWGETHLLYGRPSGFNGANGDIEAGSNPANASWLGQASYYAEYANFVGDANGDGNDEFMIGGYAYLGGNQGKVWLINGSSTSYSGFNKDLGTSTNYERTWDGNAYDYLSKAMAGGDLNNNSYSDIILGAELGRNTFYVPEVGTGRVYIIYGSSNLPASGQIWFAPGGCAGFACDATIMGERVNDQFGGWRGVSTADVNDDDYADLLMSAYGYDQGGISNRGKLYLWYGSSSTLIGDHNVTATASNATWMGEGASDYLEILPRRSKDITGDGGEDIVVSGFGYTANGISQVGKVYVFGDNPTETCEDVTTNKSLTGDVAATGSCYNISGDNLQFDCNGYTITGDGTGIGIAIYDKENTSIVDCILSNFSYGVYINFSNSTNITNSILNDSTTDILANDSQIRFIDSKIEGYELNRAGLTVKNTSKGILQFLNTSMTASGTNFSADVNMTNTTVFVNTTNSPGLNTSAMITLYGLAWDSALVQYDAEDDGTFTTCSSTTDPECYYLSQSGNTIIFNTTHFTTFNITKNVECGDWIYSDVNLTGNLTISVGSTCLEAKAHDITIDCQGYNIISIGSGTAILAQGYNGLIVKNCNIQKYTNGIQIAYGNHSVIINNSFFSQADDSIYIYPFGISGESWNHTIENNTINNSPGIEIYTANSTIKNNIFNYTHRIEFNAFGSAYQKVHDNWLYDNTFDMGLNSGANTGVFNLVNAGVYNNIIENNTIIQTENIGIYMYRTRNNTAKGNTIHRINKTGYPGIDIWQSNYSTITDNTILNVSSHGFRNYQSDYTNFTGNSADNCSYYGFKVFGGSDFVTLDNNTVGYSQYDVYIDDASGSNEDTTIINNQFDSYYFSGANLTFETTENGKITFLDNITIDGSSRNLSQEIVIGNNRVYVNSTSAPEFNISANVTIISTPSPSAPYPLFDIEDDGTYLSCSQSSDPACYNLSYDSGTGSLTFNTTHFTTFTTSAAACGTNINADLTFNMDVYHTGSGNCMNITNDSVTIDCAGYSITGDLTAGSIGIYSNNQENITIKNCQIQGFEDGIYLIGTDLTNITNNSIHNHSGYGVYASGSNYLNITNNTIYNLSQGIELASNSRYANVDQNTIYLCDNSGIILDSDSNCTENIINTSYTGISINNDGNKVSLNFVHNNTIGLFINTGQNNVLENNRAHNNTVEGILVNGQYNNLTNNSAFDNLNYGFQLGTSGHNNIFKNNTAGNNAAYDIFFDGFPSYNTFFVPYMYNYSIRGLTKFIHPSYGEIQFIDNIAIGTIGINLSADIVINGTTFFVNSTAKQGMNKSANITAYNIVFNRPIVEMDLDDDGVFSACNNTTQPTCYNLSYSGGNFKFNTTHFTTYRVVETNDPPNTTAIIHNSTGLNYTTSDDLTCYANVTDDANTTLTVYWQWFNGTTQMLSGITTGVSNATMTLITTLDSGNTSAADNWTCSVLASDGEKNDTNWDNASQEIGSACGETLAENSQYFLTGEYLFSSKLLHSRRR